METGYAPPPLILGPYFAPVKDTTYAGRCNDNAVDDPTPRGPDLAASQFSSCPSWSCPVNTCYWSDIQNRVSELV